MRILIVSPFRHDAVGGVASAVRFLGREFVESGHEVTLLARGETNTPAEVVSDGEMPVFTVGLRDFGSERIGPGVLERLRAAVACLVWSPVSLWGLSRFLHRVNPDVVFIQYPRPRMFGFGLLRLVSQWKLVLTFQGSDVHQLPNYTAASRGLIRWLVFKADRVTAVSQSLMKHLSAETGLPAASMVVIPNGTPAIQEHEDITLPPLPQRFAMTAGKLIPRKGIDVLVRAVGQLKREGCEIPVIVAGEGAERSRLVELTVSEGVDDLVQFVGELDHRRTLAMMRRAEVFVLASRAEGLPLVLAEAMGCGTPVVATDVDGAQEIIPNRDFGLLVESDNVDELANAMRTMWLDEALRSRISCVGKERVRREFQWDSIARRYLEEVNAIACPRRIKTTTSPQSQMASVEHVSS